MTAAEISQLLKAVGTALARFQLSKSQNSGVTIKNPANAGVIEDVIWLNYDLQGKRGDYNVSVRRQKHTVTAVPHGIGLPPAAACSSSPEISG